MSLMLSSCFTGTQEAKREMSAVVPVFHYSCFYFSEFLYLLKTKDR